MKNDHYIGHRQRLKERILNNSPEDLIDYELVELMLFFAIPRKDVKPLAKKLLEVFGNVNNILHADVSHLLEVEGVNQNIYTLLLMMKEFARRSLEDKIINQPILSSWATLLDYLKLTIGNSKVEKFRVLFLNKKNILIADELMASGTIDQTPVYPREIIKRALFHEAGAIVLVHNHPSGNTKPSKSDIELTNKIVEACNSINISVHDHVIVGKSEYFSFKSHLLL